MTTVYEARQLQKKRAELYREAAVKKFGNAGNVHPMSDGAFVEVSIWIPLVEIEPPPIRCVNGHVWSHDMGSDWTPEDGTACDCARKLWGCRCGPTCETVCQGQCGCQVCRASYQDFLSQE